MNCFSPSVSVLMAFAFLSMAGECPGSAPILRSADLAPFTEIHRLVIVFPGNSKKAEAFLVQWEIASIRAQMNERSLLVFRVVDRDVIAQLRKQMGSDKTGYRVWLVGIGGHLLFSTGREIEPWEIFARVDALPGRKAEIRLYNDWVAGRRLNP